MQKVEIVACEDNGEQYYSIVVDGKVDSVLDEQEFKKRGLPLGELTFDEIVGYFF